MKTKQKAIRRCSPPLDLPPDVGKMDCHSETSKRNHSVCGDVVLNTLSANVNKKKCVTEANLSCESSVEPLQKRRKQDQKLTGSYESAKYSVANANSMANCGISPTHQMRTSQRKIQPLTFPYSFTRSYPHIW